MKIDNKNQLKIVVFTAVQNRCILHGRVFVMKQIMITRLCNIPRFNGCSISVENCNIFIFA